MTTTCRGDIHMHYPHFASNTVNKPSNFAFVERYIILKECNECSVSSGVLILSLFYLVVMK